MTENRITRMGQIKVYFGKCKRLFGSEKQWKNFVSTAIIMVIISMVTSSEMFVDYKATRNGGFAIICACIWIGLFNSIQSICRERDIIKREYRTGLHISSYILAHAAYEFCLCFVETLIVLAFLLIKNITHLPPEGLIFGVIGDYFITLLLVLYASDMIAIMISCCVKNENEAMTVMPFVLIIQLVMSGSVFELHGISNLISNFTFSKWGLNGIISVANNDFIVKAGYIYAGHDGCDSTASNLLGIWLILIGFSLLFIFLSTIILKKVDKDSR